MAGSNVIHLADPLHGRLADLLAAARGPAQPSELSDESAARALFDSGAPGTHGDATEGDATEATTQAGGSTDGATSADGCHRATRQGHRHSEGHRHPGSGSRRSGGPAPTSVPEQPPAAVAGSRS